MTRVPSGTPALTALLFMLLLDGCATTAGEGVKRNRLRDCPPGSVLICESRRPQEPSRGGDEEIPEYEFCRCESVM